MEYVRFSDRLGESDSEKLLSRLKHKRRYKAGMTPITSWPYPLKQSLNSLQQSTEDDYQRINRQLTFIHVSTFTG